jgi:hypothetical protein
MRPHTAHDGSSALAYPPRHSVQSNEQAQDGEAGSDVEYCMAKKQEAVDNLLESLVWMRRNAKKHEAVDDLIDALMKMRRKAKKKVAKKKTAKEPKKRALKRRPR